MNELTWEQRHEGHDIVAYLCCEEHNGAKFCRTCRVGLVELHQAIKYIRLDLSIEDNELKVRGV